MAGFVTAVRVLAARRAIAVSVMLAWLPAPGALAQPAGEALPVAAIAGCYAVELGPWVPDLGQTPSNDGVFLIPPGEVVLTAEQVPHRGADVAYAVRPAPGARPSVHDISVWLLRPPDGVTMTFSNGHSGLTLALAVRGDTLVGQARSFWDFPRRPQTASAALRRVPCR